MLLSIFTISPHCGYVAQNDSMIDTQAQVLGLLANNSASNSKIFISILFLFFFLNLLYWYGKSLMNLSAAFRFIVHILSWCVKCAFPLFLLYRFSSFLPFWYENYENILVFVSLVGTVSLWASKSFSTEFWRFFGSVQLLLGGASLIEYLGEFHNVTLSLIYFITLPCLGGFKMFTALSQMILYFAVASASYTVANAFSRNSTFKNIAQRLTLSLALLSLCSAFFVFNHVIYTVLYEFTGWFVGIVLSSMILRYKNNKINLLKLLVFFFYCLILLIGFWHVAGMLSAWFNILAEAFLHYSNGELYYAQYNEEEAALANLLAFEKLEWFVKYYYHVNVTKLVGLFVTLVVFYNWLVFLSSPTNVAKNASLILAKNATLIQDLGGRLLFLMIVLLLNVSFAELFTAYCHWLDHILSPEIQKAVEKWNQLNQKVSPEDVKNATAALTKMADPAEQVKSAVRIGVFGTAAVGATYVGLSVLFKPTKVVHLSTVYKHVWSSKKGQWIYKQQGIKIKKISHEFPGLSSHFKDAKSFAAKFGGGWW